MKPVSAINRLLNRLQARFRTARSGSVLILVVALLVLMALLGTAFISTARIDRYSATVNSAITEIDLLVQGIVNMAVGNVVDDLYDPTPNAAFGNARDYRKPPLDGGALANAYEHHDSPAVDRFLADRVPTLFNPAAPISAANPPLWRSVSWPLSARADGTYWFDRPGIGRSIELTGAKNQYLFVPTSGTVAGQVRPFLRIFQNGTEFDSDPSTTGTQPMLAADADGDGIADAGLWKIPLGAIDGVTYYAAARIIDNNSAINVNTALSRSADFTSTGAADFSNAMFFPSRVGLAEMLRTFTANGSPRGTSMTKIDDGSTTGPGAEMDLLNVFRFNPDPPDTAAPTNPPNTTPLDEQGNPPDVSFAFTSVGDALNSQLARRIKNPGRNDENLYQTHGIGESMTLAYKFVLANVNVSPSLLEQQLPMSLRAGVRVSPYAPSSVAAWYEDNFEYEAEVPATPNLNMPLRALLVASNPVANQAPANYAIADVNGDSLRNDLPAGLSPGMAPYVAAGGQQQPNPPRVSINTAPFGDLYRAFWNVMVEEAELAPVDATLTLFDASGGQRDARMDPYYGQRFDPLPPYASIPTEQNPARTFRTLIRDTRMPYAGPGGINRMLPEDVLKVRAALAAVNAIDLRDSVDDVTEATITVNVIRDNTSDTFVEPTQVRVYGTEAQPFITEVYANLNTEPVIPFGVNPNGYVAIELSNPYPVAIELKGAAGSPGWTVGLIDRRATPVKTELAVKHMDLANALRFDFDDGLVIPPGGKLILENYNPDGPSDGSATYRPEGTGLLPTTAVPGTVYVPHLHRVFQSPTDLEAGGEFVLLRPRSGAGVAIVGPDLDGDGTADFDETANLYDMIPADSFDFTGIVMTPGPGAALPFYPWMHYVRENGPGFDWRFVYPGRYDASASETPHAELGTPHGNPRHQGVQIAAIGGTDGIAEIDILLEKPVALGAPDPVPPGAGYYTNPFTIQVANQDFGGHNKIGSVTPAQFPFGAFARDGDILQVPFIGAYVIDSPDAGALPGAFLEMNSLSMDSVLAEDTDTSNDPDPTVPMPAAAAVQEREQVGRFYPVARNTNIPPVPAGETDDFHDGVANANLPTEYNPPGEYWNFTQSGDDPADPDTYVPQWRYRWAMDLFDHITVQAPHDDHFPNMNKSVHTTVQPVSNSGGPAGDSTDTQITVREAEHREPIEGLININTASWKVLSALPLVISDGTSGLSVNFTGTAPPAGEVFPALTRELAQIIVYYRDVDADPFTAGNQPHGPFRTIMELNKVVDTRNPNAAVPNKGPAITVELNARPGFRNAMGTVSFAPGAGEPNDDQGDFSPAAAAADGVRADFEEKSLALSRISNLITTRSDSFTCYILVQGYRDAESANPELIVERRVAFLLDRSGTVPAFPQPVVTKIPNN